jgi:hypothetical protein
LKVVDSTMENTQNLRPTKFDTPPPSLNSLWQTFYKGPFQNGLPADFVPLWQTFRQHCIVLGLQFCFQCISCQYEFATLNLKKHLRCAHEGSKVSNFIVKTVSSGKSEFVGLVDSIPLQSTRKLNSVDRFQQVLEITENSNIPENRS